MDQRIIRDASVAFGVAVAQAAGLVRFEEGTINIVLVAMVSYAFMARGFKEYVVLVFCAVYGLTPGIGIEKSALVFGAVMCGVYGARAVLPLRRGVLYPVLLCVATLVLYAVLDPRFIIHAPFLFTRELAYTLLCGMMFSWYYARQPGY